MLEVSLIHSMDQGVRRQGIFFTGASVAGGTSVVNGPEGIDIGRRIILTFGKCLMRPMLNAYMPVPTMVLQTVQCVLSS